MRVVSGYYKGRKIKSPKKGVRPTTDFIKEALFSMIGDSIEDSSFLDLFGGSGSISIEASSRGAQKIDCIEKNRLNCSIIEENLKALDIKNVKVINLDVFKFLKNCLNQYDIIFMDPPYKMDLYEKIIDLIIDNNLLKKDGIIICEMDSKKDLKLDKLSLYKNKKYGNSRVVIYENI